MKRESFESSVAGHIKLRNASRFYSQGNVDDSSAVGLFDVSCDIYGGEYVAVVGPSGSGKTTLLNLMSGLDQADSGEVTVSGTDLRKASERELSNFRLREVGIVFQDSLLVSELSVFANIAMPGLLKKDNKRQVRSFVLDTLDRLGMAPFARRLPHELSGGQRQRVAVARAIINNPAVIVADEPTGSLDSEHGRQVIELLEEYNGGGATLIIVTHDPSIASRARRQIRVEDGKLLPSTPSGTHAS